MKKLYRLTTIVEVEIKDGPLNNFRWALEEYFRWLYTEHRGVGYAGPGAGKKPVLFTAKLASPFHHAGELHLDDPKNSSLAANLTKWCTNPKTRRRRQRRGELL